MALMLLPFFLLFAVTSIRLIIRKPVEVYCTRQKKKKIQETANKMESQNKRAFSTETRILKLAHHSSTRCKSEYREQFSGSYSSEARTQNSAYDAVMLKSIHV